MKTSLAIWVGLALGAAGAWAGDYPVRPVPFTDVRLTGGFWQLRFDTNRATTLWYDFRKCEETGRIANFARAGKLEAGPFEGIPFNDSDVFKVMEGAAYILALQPDPELDAYLDGLIAKVAAAQEPDGYLFTARTLGSDHVRVGPARWSKLRISHELYNVGHMYEAAVAHHQATGKRSFLEVALRNADLIAQVFGPGEEQRIEVPGHQEIEIGLVRLYRATGNEKYLQQAKFFLDMRGRADKRATWGPGQQDHLLVLEQKEAVGHSVRAGYMYAGMADVAALTGEPGYVAAIGRIWQDVVGRKMFLTGGVGLVKKGEGYGEPYDLGGNRSYSETCAAIANALWAHRMFLLRGEAGYMDVFERLIYNGILAGVALSGDRFHYCNPLATDGRELFNKNHNDRAPWFDCSCCPVNVVRFIPSLTGYVYATVADAVHVSLYLTSQGHLRVRDIGVSIEQATDYPWSGRVRLKVTPEQVQRFELRLRVPGWARNQPVPSDLYRYEGAIETAWTVRVNGQRAPASLRNGYALLDREWRAGDVVELDLPMPVRRLVSHEKIAANAGLVAIERGPIVYCAEGADNGGSVAGLSLPPGVDLQPKYRSDLLGGLVTLTGRTSTAPTLIPYYAWNHREKQGMAVWLPIKRGEVNEPR